MRMKRILVIRGGAIGDFILTLPALKALRDACPHAYMEILGYKHIAVLAEKRFYAQAVRSIEYGPLSSFFARNSELPAELANYFASFDLIISYLYDPDRIFENNLRRCGVENLLCGPAKIVESAEHAARQLAQPVEEMGIRVGDLTEKVFPSIDDRQFAQEFLQALQQPRWKSGLLCFREAVISRSTKTNASGPADCLPLSSFQARRIRHRRSYWNASGKIQWSVSPRTYGCPTSPRCLSVRSSLGTIVASRTSPQPRAQIAFCFLDRRIPMYGHPGTKTCEFLARPAES